MDVETSDLWTCPRCGKRFVTLNMSHSCGSHTVDAFMEGKGPNAWAYWNRLQEMVGNCGPYSIVANKTQLDFMVRVRFVGTTAISERGMRVAFWLKSEIESPRFGRIESLGTRDRIYHLRISSIQELDDEVQQWLCMAYEVGCQRVPPVDR